MTVTRILFYLASFNILWSRIHANQPDGYVGCFQDSVGNSLMDSEYLYFDYNEGERCKASCKKQKKRYSGTQGPFCYCGSGVNLSKKRDSGECNLPCPGNPSEKCGGRCYWFVGCYYNRMSIYDTWFCITAPCQNSATCTDIDAESYNCSCSVGWTGRICDESVTATSTTIFSSSSLQPLGSSTTPQKQTATTYSISPSSSRQGIVSSTVEAQPSKNKLAIYIAVPVSIVVLIVFVLIVAVLILRKRLSRNKDGRKAVNQTSANVSHSVIAVANNAYNDHDIIPLETSVNNNATEDAPKGESEHSYYTLEQTEYGNRNFNSVEQRSGSAVQDDDNSYEHLHARSTALCDPTYSHTTTTGPQGTTDDTYSHMDRSVGNLNQELKSKVDRDTYNTCNMKVDVGRLRPAVEITDTDDTYNRLAISGKATNISVQDIISNVNEPDYDHTDVKNH